MISKIKNAWYVIKKSYQWLFKYPSLLLIPLIEVAIYIGLIATFFSLFYWKYQVHIFNEETFVKLGFISIWESSVFSLILIGPLYFFSSIALLCSQLSITYSYKSIQRTKRPHVVASIFKSLKQFGQVLRYALLSTMVAVTFEPGLKRYFKKMIRLLGGHEFLEKTHLDTWHEQTFLILPLIGFEGLTTRKAVSRSRTLMNDSFGPHPTAQAGFMKLAFVLMVISTLLAFTLVEFLYHRGIGIIFILSMVSLIRVIIRDGEGVFQIATYYYCLDKPSKIMDKKSVQKMFKSEP